MATSAISLARTPLNARRLHPMVLQLALAVFAESLALLNSSSTRPVKHVSHIVLRPLAAPLLPTGSLLVQHLLDNAVSVSLALHSRDRNG